ncbi:MAG: hypothetical protein Q7T54_01735 [Candidatus Levybacteria bacterium]|nr:hypothetical protein [Candidatus Levybacteria bacterium]
MTEGQIIPRPELAPRAPENDRHADIAFLLDVDGVVTDPTKKQVLEPQIFTDIEANLASGNPVTLNTGRSNEWMIDRVISPLASKVKDKGVLNNFFAVGEKGLTWVSFDSQGKLIKGVFNREGVPVEGYDLKVFLDAQTASHFSALAGYARALIKEKYSHSTFFDDSKHAMVSTEMIDGFNQPQYAAEQTQFTQELKDILKKLGVEGKFNVDPTTIATDIQMPHVGKHLGAQRVLDWLGRNKIAPKHYVAVGDSASDLEMADELKSQGKSYEFRYVNPGKPLEEKLTNGEDKKPKHNLKVSSQPFSKGLVEVFQSLKKTA